LRALGEIPPGSLEASHYTTDRALFIPLNDPPDVERPLWHLGPIGRHVNGPLPTPWAKRVGRARRIARQ